MAAAALDHRFAGVALVLLGAAACGGATSVSQVGGPGDVRCATSITPQSASVPHGGGEVGLTVSATRECAWTATASAAWVRLSRATGQGSTTLNVTVDANQAGAPREALVSLNDSQLSLTQGPAPCAFELTTTSGLMSHTGGHSRIFVATIEGCAWQAAASVGWLRVATDLQRGPGVVDVEVLPNDGAERQGHVTIANRQLAIVQSGAPVAPLPPPTPPGPPPADPTPPPTDPVPPPVNPMPPPEDPVPPPADPIPPPVDPVPPPVDPISPPEDPVPPPGDPIPPPGDPIPPPGDPIPPPGDPSPPPDDPAPPPGDPTPPPDDPAPPPGDPTPPPDDPAPPQTDPTPPPGAPTSSSEELTPAPHSARRAAG